MAYANQMARASSLCRYRLLAQTATVTTVFDRGPLGPGSTGALSWDKLVRPRLDQTLLFAAAYQRLILPT